MPGIESVRTIKVNEALADPESQAPSLVESRYQEVVALGWVATSEITEYGRYRRDRREASWIVPTREEETSVTHERVISLVDGTDIDVPFAEVTMPATDPERIRCFLVQSDERNPLTKQFDRRLVIFRAPNET